VIGKYELVLLNVIMNEDQESTALNEQPVSSPINRQDDQLISTEYDAILYGTGLTQSILASALCRAGKSVLHCDSNPFYGELDAVLNLNELQSWVHRWSEKEEEEEMDATASIKPDITSLQQESKDDPADNKSTISSLNINPRGNFTSLKFHSMNSMKRKSGKTSDLLKVQQTVVTPYGLGTIINLPSSNNENAHSLEVKLHTWIMADGKSPIAYFGYPSTPKTVSYTSAAITSYYALQDNIIPLHEFQLQTYVLNEQYSRSYSLDLTPSVLLAQGKAVDGLVTAGVADYCEFKSLIGLYWLSSRNDKQETGRSKRGSVAKSRKSRQESKGCQVNTSSLTKNYTLLRVPCSKGDVFQTKLFSPLDKRKLMKFLQIASDYAIATTITDEGTNNTMSVDENREDNQTEDEITASGQSSSNASTDTNKQERSTLLLDEEKEENVTSLNERQLQQGRSLYRPQNKNIATSDLELLQECIDQDMDFETYLQKHHKFSERQRQIVIYAIAMGCLTANGSTNTGNDAISASNSTANVNEDEMERREDSSSMATYQYSTKDGMADICRHVQSLGRYGSTAFLVPLYGSGELCQAFCRSAAVHGGIYLLRHGVTQVLLQKQSESTNITKDGSKTMDTLKTSNDEDARFSVRGAVIDSSSHDDKQEIDTVFRYDSKDPNNSHTVSSKHVVVPSAALDKTEFTSIGKGRASTSSSNKEKRRVFRRVSILRDRVIVNDSEQRHILVLPPNIIGNPHAIYGIALDDSANIAPYNYPSDFKTTVLHLTTIADEKDVGDQEDPKDDVLKRAVDSILASQLEGDVSGDAEELFHLSFSYAYDAGMSDVQEEDDINDFIGLHICSKQRHLVTVESAFEEAKVIFQKICPDCDFLCHSDQMSEVLKQRNIGRDDDEDQDGMMLESAMNMI